MHRRHPTESFSPSTPGHHPLSDSCTDPKFLIFYLIKVIKVPSLLVLAMHPSASWYLFPPSLLSSSKFLPDFMLSSYLTWVAQSHTHPSVSNFPITSFIFPTSTYSNSHHVWDCLCLYPLGCWVFVPLWGLESYTQETSSPYQGRDHT